MDKSMIDLLKDLEEDLRNEALTSDWQMLLETTGIRWKGWLNQGV